MYDLNWQARRVAVLISIPGRHGHESLVLPTHLVTAMSQLHDVENATLEDEGLGGGDACRSPEVLVSVCERTGACDSVPWRKRQQKRLSSVKSPAHMHIYGEWDLEHMPYVDIQRLYRKLYTQNIDSWRLVILFL